MLIAMIMLIILLTTKGIDLKWYWYPVIFFLIIAGGIVFGYFEQRSGLKINKDFWVASCPERANPGNIMENLITIPRIVGASDNFARNIVTHFYKSVFNVEIIEVSNPRTANSVKLKQIEKPFITDAHKLRGWYVIACSKHT